MTPRMLQLLTSGLIAVSALAACRKEVPPPPVPVPEKEPRPVTQAVYLALGARTPAAPVG